MSNFSFFKTIIQSLKCFSWSHWDKWIWFLWTRILILSVGFAILDPHLKPKGVNLTFSYPWFFDLLDKIFRLRCISNIRLDFYAANKFHVNIFPVGILANSKFEERMMNFCLCIFSKKPTNAILSANVTNHGWLKVKVIP